jgi:hypothetical protein
MGTRRNVIIGPPRIRRLASVDSTLDAERFSDSTAPEDSPPLETPQRAAVSQEEALLAGRRSP